MLKPPFQARCLSNKILKTTHNITIGKSYQVFSDYKKDDDIYYFLIDDEGLYTCFPSQMFEVVEKVKIKPNEVNVDCYNSWINNLFSL